MMSDAEVEALMVEVNLVICTSNARVYSYSEHQVGEVAYTFYFAANNYAEAIVVAKHILMTVESSSEFDPKCLSSGLSATDFFTVSN